MGQRASVHSDGTGTGSGTGSGSEFTRVSRIAQAQLSQLEKYSVRQHDLSTDESIANALRLNAVNTDVLLRSAKFLASYPHGQSRDVAISEGVEKVIGFYNGRLRQALSISDSEWIRLLFLSMANTRENKELASDVYQEVDQFYLVYDDLLNLWAILVCVFDANPRNGIDVTVANKEHAEQLLLRVKAPIVSHDNFVKLVDAYPYLLQSLAVIWDQLLYDEESTIRVESDEKCNLRIPRDILANLYFNIGPKILDSSLLLYNGRKDGFSMQAFEVAVTKWRKPSMIIVQGHLNSKPKITSDIDRYLPPVYDVPPLDPGEVGKQVRFAIYVESQWKSSAKKCFAESESTKVYALGPSLDVLSLASDSASVFFAPSVGIGAGFAPPQRVGNVSNGTGVFVLIDTALERAVFRYIHNRQSSALPNPPKSWEARFDISQVHVIGLGTQKDLDIAKGSWEVENKDAERHKNINIHEDRALLEMAGLVGQYDRGD